METLKFIVVGTGRCGTRYIAEQLTQAGISCGHEWVYLPHARRTPHIAILGDSSAQAAPFVPDFPGFVFHQVRHPLKVIGSFLGFGLFHDDRQFGPDGDFMARHFRFTGDVLGDTMRYYVEWNTRCERSARYLRCRVEDVDHDLLQRIAGAIGVEVDDRAIARALETVPTNTHSLNNFQTVTWNDVPAGPSKDELVRIAGRYRYDPPRPRRRVALGVEHRSWWARRALKFKAA
jgi:hypothetical protein